jgi:hypothetical protein
MTVDAMALGILIFVCTGVGMFLGAFFAARGFEKSLLSMLDDPEAPWNQEE